MYTNFLFLIVLRYIFVVLFPIHRHHTNLKCLAVENRYSMLLICKTPTSNVTSLYLLSILDGIFTNKLSLAILFGLCTVFPYKAYSFSPKTSFAMLMCLQSIPHSLIPLVSILSPKPLYDGRHRQS